MQKFEFKSCEIEGVKIITPFLAEDDRGYFLKNYEKEIFSSEEIYTDIYQNFESYSHYGVIRGLHFQLKNPQAKIIRCTQGKVWDVVVDVRKKSVSQGKWQGFELSSEENKSIYIPEGCAHGFISLTEGTKVSYICSGRYLQGFDSGILWNDTVLDIKWPVQNNMNVILSDRDKKLPTYKEFLDATDGGL